MTFDDFPPGYRFTTSAFSLTEAQIIAFAQENDPQPFHTDPVAAVESPYGGIIASGFQTMIEVFKKTLAEGGWAGASMGSPGMDEIRWYLPVRPGDSCHVEAEVESARASSSKPDRGFTVIRYDVINQDGAKVMSYKATHMLRRAVPE